MYSEYSGHLSIEDTCFFNTCFFNTCTNTLVPPNTADGYFTFDVTSFNSILGVCV